MKTIYFLIGVILLLSSCSGILDIENPNTLDRETANGDPEEIENISKSLFYNWYGAQTTSVSPRMSMWVMADQGTSSWANSAMLDLSSEPREAIDNTESYKYASTFYNYWSRLHTTMSQANKILDVTVVGGMELGNIDDNGKGDKTEMIKAQSYFVKGLSYGYLGLVYDQAFYLPVEIVGDISNYLTPRSYETIVDSAINNLNHCIQICETNSFTIPSDWINGREYSNNDLNQICNSYIARLMMFKSRNAEQNSSNDWQTILEYANKGISTDFQVYADNVTWYNYFFRYTVARDNWVRIDARIINMLDPDYPWRLNDATNPGVATSLDARLSSDFRYDPVCGFKPERGYYHFSYYEYSRYPYNTSSNPDWINIFSFTENDLIKAEAMFRTGDKSGAISLLNSGTRVTRGSLTSLEANISDTEFLEALFYERDIELIMTGFGTAFFDMRRRDMLQEGTPLHFPMPAKELGVNGIPLYTFGGVANADGINTSNGGWFPLK